MHTFIEEEARNGSTGTGHDGSAHKAHTVSGSMSNFVEEEAGEHEGTRLGASLVNVHAQ